MPFFWNVKISCMLITFSSMPVISWMLTHLRDAVAQARALHNDGQCRSDLLPHGLFRKTQVAHRHHRFETGQGIARRIGVDGCHRTFVARIHGLQHVECFFAADLTDDDAIGTHTEAVDEQLPLPDRSLALDVRRPRLKTHNVFLRQL